MPHASRLATILGAAALALVLAASPAAAEEGRRVVVPLAGGKSIEGVVESADAKEVVLRVGPEERRRVPWTQVTALGVYRVREALTPAADGPRRLDLAELAADLGLFAEARVEYEKALALGAVDSEHFAALVSKAERAAVEQGVETAKRLADAGDVSAALEVARGLKLAFGEAPNAADIRALIEGLLAQLSDEDAAAAKETAELQKLEAQARRQKEILERKTRADERIATGDGAAVRSAEAREKGNVTRATKAGEEADGAYTEARRNLGRLRRILPLEDAPARDQVAAKLNELDRKQFALLLAMAKFYAAPGARNYSRAERWAAKAAYIDPVDPDLIELRQKLVESRIRYRLSDVTNARPIVR